MLTKLFEAIDDKILTADLQAEITESFNEAVETKAKELLEAKTSELEILAEEFAEKEISEAIETLSERVDSYLELAVQKFVEDSASNLEESLKQENADMVIEAFDSMVLASGIKLSDIVEAKDENSLQAKLDEKIAAYDSLVESMIAKDKDFDSLLQAGIIAEAKSGLSIVEAEKFERLAEVVPFSKDADYANKLDVLKESVTNVIVKKEEVIVESNDSKPSWMNYV